MFLLNLQEKIKFTSASILLKFETSISYIDKSILKVKHKFIHIQQINTQKL